MIKAILCDRDGVLINSEIVNIGASLQSLADMEVQTEKADEMIVMGKHPKDYVADFVEKYHIDGEEFLMRRKVIYRKMLFEANLFSDTVAILHELKKRGLYTGLVTSANRDITHDILDHFSLRSLFDIIVTFDDCKKRKPHPEPYLKGAELLHVTPAECLVFEDSQIGLRAAKDAGMMCVIRINEKNKSLNFHEADLVLHDLHEVGNFIKKLCEEEK